MHISDGVLSAPVLIGGYAVSGALTVFISARMKPDEIPKVAVMTSAFFVASLVHVPLGVTSVHLVLNGLSGIILGWNAIPSIFVGLLFQALMFQHGGLTSLGVNAVVMGFPALAAFGAARFLRRFSFRGSVFIRGFSAGALSIALSGILLACALCLSGKEFLEVAELALLAHIPVLIIEGIVTGFALQFLMRVKPAMPAK